MRELFVKRLHRPLTPQHSLDYLDSVSEIEKHQDFSKMSVLGGTDLAAISNDKPHAKPPVLGHDELGHRQSIQSKMIVACQKCARFWIKRRRKSFLRCPFVGL